MKWRWFIPALATVVLIVVLIPVSVWRHPVDEASYRGFDANLVSTDPVGAGTAAGVVQVSKDAIDLTATPGSNPTANVFSTALNFAFHADVRVVQNDGVANPLEVRIWSPRRQAEEAIVFGPAPLNQVTERAGSSEYGSSTRLLGSYLPGSTYQLNVAFDRESGQLTTRITGNDAPPSNHDSILLVGGPSESGYREPNSAYMKVTAGHTYHFGGLIRLLSGTNYYKVVIDWFDAKKNHVGSSNDWRPGSELNGWTKRDFTGTAPKGATQARVILGAGNGRTRFLMTDLFVTDAAAPAGNLLVNGDFAKGSASWTLNGATDPSEKPTIIPPGRTDLTSIVTRDQVGDFFYRLPVALSLSASAQTGIANSVFNNYHLTLPEQPGAGIRTGDMHATLVLAALLGLAGAAVGAATLFWILGRVRMLRAAGPSGWRRWLHSSATVREAPLICLAGLAIAFYLLGNAFLFHLGSHSYDMAGQKTFAYTGARYGVASIYYLPATTTPARIWGGVPFAEVPFPYGPVMAVIFAGIGWVYRLFLADPQGLRLDAIQLEILIKAVNVSFGLIDGLLIYAILRRIRVSRRASLIAAALFLFNPAVWFLMSVWGETQTISLSLVLAALWLGERNWLIGAWVFLAAAVMTRPQMIVIALVIGLFYLRRFSIRQNLLGVGWAVIAVFLVVAPLTFSIGPSQPVDYLRQTLHTQTEVDPGAGLYNYVSNDGYNIWPLFTGYVSGQSGHSRLYYTANQPLFGSVNYGTAGNVLLTAVLALVSIALLMGRPKKIHTGAYLPFVATATMALLVLKTGVSAHHFVLALVVILLCRKFLSSSVFYLMVGAVSVSMLVSMWGSLGFAISQVGGLAPALFGQNNAFTALSMKLFLNDNFITIAACANGVILLAMAWVTVQQLLSRGDDEVRRGRVPIVVPSSQVVREAQRDPARF